MGPWHHCILWGQGSSWRLGLRSPWGKEALVTYTTYQFVLPHHCSASPLPSGYLGIAPVLVEYSGTPSLTALASAWLQYALLYICDHTCVCSPSRSQFTIRLSHYLNEPRLPSFNIQPNRASMSMMLTKCSCGVEVRDQDQDQGSGSKAVLEEEEKNFPSLIFLADIGLPRKTGQYALLFLFILNRASLELKESEEKWTLDHHTDLHHLANTGLFSYLNLELWRYGPQIGHQDCASRVGI